MTFTKGLGLALAATLVVATGCSKTAPGGSSSESKKGSTTTTETPGETPTTKASAEAFLKSLGEGKIAAGQLTVGFKKLIAPPITDADKMAGFSPGEVSNWLKAFEQSTFVVSQETTFGNAIALRGRVESGAKKDAFSVRLVRDGNELKCDWLQRTSRWDTVEPKKPYDAEVAAAQDVARNFLDTLLGGDLRPTLLLMSLDWKKLMAPYKSDPGYDAAFVVGKLKMLRNDAVSYSLAKAEAAGADQAKFGIDLEIEGKKVPYTLLAKKIDGRWVVDSFRSN
jgi:hypothetical protein